MGKRKLTRKQCVDALKSSRGNVSRAADKLRVERNALYRAIQYHGLEQLLHDQRERVVDVAEERLYDSVCAGKRWAVSLTLRTIGRKRGYVEQDEATNTSPEAVAEFIARLANAQLVRAGQQTEPVPSGQEPA